MAALQDAADTLEVHHVDAEKCWHALERCKKAGMILEEDLWPISVWEAAEEGVQIVLDSFGVKGRYILCIEPTPEFFSC